MIVAAAPHQKDEWDLGGGVTPKSRVETFFFFLHLSVSARFKFIGFRQTVKQLTADLPPLV